MVPRTGLEPVSREGEDFKSSVYTDSTIWARLLEDALFFESFYSFCRETETKGDTRCRILNIPPEKIRKESTLGTTDGVRDIIPDRGSFSGELTDARHTKKL